jgi:ankyrin repeat protein
VPSIRIETQTNLGSMSFFGDISSITNELWLAACKDDYVRVAQLILRGDDPRVRESVALCSPLHIACLLGHIETVLVLLRAHEMTYKWRNMREIGARGRSMPRRINLISENDADFQTPLHYACHGLQPRVVEILIAYGADVSSSVGYVIPRTPMDFAARGTVFKFRRDRLTRIEPQEPNRIESQIELVDILLEAGAIQSLFPAFEGSIWQTAIEEDGGKTKLLDFLLRRNIVIPTFDGGRCILHGVSIMPIANCRNDRDVIVAEILVAYGVNPFHRDDRGETPMHEALRLGRCELSLYFFSLLLKTEGYTRDTLNEYRRASSDVMWDRMLQLENQLRGEALCMGQHPRLGIGSQIKDLPMELLREMFHDTE